MTNPLWGGEDVPHRRQSYKFFLSQTTVRGQLELRQRIGGFTS